MQKRICARKFKLRAVALLEGEGKSVPQLLKGLNVAESNLYTWRAKFKEEIENTFINEPLEDVTALELRRLRAENAPLREEREILKKIAAWFAKESGN